MGGIFTSLPAILISPGQDLIATLGLGGSALRGRYCNVPLHHAPVRRTFLGIPRSTEALLGPNSRCHHCSRYDTVLLSQLVHIIMISLYGTVSHLLHYSALRYCLSYIVCT